MINTGENPARTTRNTENRRSSTCGKGGISQGSAQKLRSLRSTPRDSALEVEKDSGPEKAASQSESAKGTRSKGQGGAPRGEERAAKLPNEAPRSSTRRTGGAAKARRTSQTTNAQKDPNPSKSRYIPALDGLRALAVLAVIAYHMGMPWAQGGLLGVTVFFVLSGYLITSLLIAEYDRTGRIDLPQFWLRRVRRLVPAIVCVIACTTALCTLLSPELLTKMRPDILPSLVFLNNWWQIFHDVSYFEALGAPSPLTHFWSLAIEEQFYLIWPVLLLTLFKFEAKRTWIRRACLVLAALSALEMAVLFSPGADPSRVYYGTDTRAFSLLIGAWLAFAWPSAQLGSLQAQRIEPSAQRVLDLVGALALVALITQIALMDGFSAVPYRGGILLCTVITAIAIAVMVHPASLLGRAFGCAPLVWVGKRSYSIYLWHYPLLLLMNPQNSASDPAWWMLLLQLAVIVTAASISYTFIENPIRHGALGRMASEVRNRLTTPAELARTHAVYLVATVAVAVVAIGGVALVPDTSSVTGGSIYQEEGQAQAAEGSEGNAGEEPQDEAQEAAYEEPAPIVMIGDSVSVRAIPNFQEAFPDGIIDAAVNRQVAAGKDVLDWYLDQGAVGNVVVFALGTNGVATSETLDALMESAGPDRTVYFVNTRCTQLWEESVNNLLADTASKHSNARLIDWHGTSAGHDEYFDGDGTHLTEEGAEAYINMVNASTWLARNPIPSLF